MTPKDQAKELVEKFDELLTYRESKTKTKECAIICVKHIVKEIQQNSFDFGATVPMSVYTYWKNVIEEIEKL